jgi:hypothetical protein
MPNFPANSIDVANQTPDARSILLNAESALLRMLYFRRQYDQRRSFFYRQYIGQQDIRKFPDNLTPRSNTFVPYPLSNVETIVSRVMDAFFSFEPWFECKGRSSQDEPGAEAMQYTLNYKLDKAKLIQAIEDLSRTICIYGHGGIKVDWDFDYDMGVEANPQFAMQPVMIPGPDGRPEPLINPQTGQPQQQPIINPQTGQPIVIGAHPQTKLIPRMRPKFIPIDIYDLLVDPDGGLVAHVVEKNMGQIMREQAISTQAAQADPSGVQQPQYLQEGVQALWDKVQALEPNNPEQVIVRIAELWNEIDGTVTIQTFGHDREALSWKDLRASFRQASITGYKRKMYGGEAILLANGPNPFFHKKAPILYTSFIKLPNEVFGLGAIEIISDLTESFNRMSNMITDNWNLGINRRYAYNTDADIDHAALNQFNVPGGKVGVVGNPNEVIAPLPFFTPQRGDYAILDVYKSMIELGSGVSDIYAKGIGSPSNNRTASGINSIINESNFRFKMFIRNLELDILQPLLAMCASMIQQFMTHEEEVRITDAPAGIQKWPVVSPEELIGDFDFDLVAANYATNKVLRQRNFLAFANWAVKTPYLNQGAFLRETAKIFEVRNISSLLKSDQQVQQEQVMTNRQQLEMVLVEKLLDTESKAIIAELSRKPGEQGGVDNATKHALQVQQFIEDFLQNYGGIPLERTGPAQFGEENQTTGRPRGMQQEGKIPGAGETSAAREIGQMTGANGMGLGGGGSS